MELNQIKHDCVNDVRKLRNIDIINQTANEREVGNQVPPLDINPPKTSSHMPFIYFVVSENKMPVQVSLLEGTNQACNHAIKTRRNVLIDKKRQLKYRQETNKLIKRQNSFVGLCVGPVRDVNGNVSTSLTNNLYPNYKLSNIEKPKVKSDIKKQTTFTGLVDYAEPFDYEPDIIEHVKKENSIINLEFPLTEVKNMPEGKHKPIRIPSATDQHMEREPPKRVQFSQCSYYRDHSRKSSSKASTTSNIFPSRSSIYHENELAQSPEKHPSGNQPSARTQTGYKCELALPKIDLMNDIYDDVIMKAIDTYMTSRNISAKRRPDMERRLISRLAMTRKYQMEVDAKIRESSATTTRGCTTFSEPEEHLPMKSISVKLTSFQMVAPGSQIHKTNVVL